MRIVSVWPADTGWEVRSDAIDNAQVFASGAKAEAAAARLAGAIARAGDDVSVHVHLRDGALAGTRMIWADEPTASGPDSAIGGGGGRSPSDSAVAAVPTRRAFPSAQG